MLKAEKRFVKDEAKQGTFAKGFISASLVACVGAMALVGSINDALGDPSTLFIKSVVVSIRFQENFSAFKLAENDKVVAIGEIGLDYHYDFSPREKQKEVFAAQLELANELGLPVIIHDREAHADTLELVKKYRI